MILSQAFHCWAVASSCGGLQAKKNSQREALTTEQYCRRPPQRKRLRRQCSRANTFYYRQVSAGTKVLALGFTFCFLRGAVTRQILSQESGTAVRQQTAKRQRRKQPKPKAAITKAYDSKEHRTKVQGKAQSARQGAKCKKTNHKATPTMALDAPTVLVLEARSSLRAKNKRARSRCTPSLSPPTMAGHNHSSVPSVVAYHSALRLFVLICGNELPLRLWRLFKHQPARL